MNIPLLILGIILLIIGIKVTFFKKRNKIDPLLTEQYESPALLLINNQNKHINISGTCNIPYKKLKTIAWHVNKLNDGLIIDHSLKFVICNNTSYYSLVFVYAPDITVELVNEMTRLYNQITENQTINAYLQSPGALEQYQNLMVRVSKMGRTISR
jgi:hypothetical protein